MSSRVTHRIYSSNWRTMGLSRSVTTKQLRATRNGAEYRMIFFAIICWRGVPRRLTTLKSSRAGRGPSALRAGGGLAGRGLGWPWHGEGSAVDGSSSSGNSAGGQRLGTDPKGTPPGKPPGEGAPHSPTAEMPLSQGLERIAQTPCQNRPTCWFDAIARKFPSSATPGRGRGCEHAGARRRRGLCRASWRAAQPVTEPVG